MHLGREIGRRGRTTGKVLASLFIRSLALGEVEVGGERGRKESGVEERRTVGNGGDGRT